MNPSMTFFLAALGGSVLAAGADPADPKAAVPSVPYRSAFEAYAAQREAELADWRAVNAEMERLGGHRGHVAGGGTHTGHGAAPAGDAAQRHQH